MDSKEIEVTLNKDDLVAKQLGDFFGFKVVIDKTMPEDVIVFRTGNTYMAHLHWCKEKDCGK